MKDSNMSNALRELGYDLYAGGLAEPKRTAVIKGEFSKIAWKDQ